MSKAEHILIETVFDPDVPTDVPLTQVATNYAHQELNPDMPRYRLRLYHYSDSEPHECIVSTAKTELGVKWKCPVCKRFVLPTMCFIAVTERKAYGINFDEWKRGKRSGFSEEAINDDLMKWLRQYKLLPAD